MCMTGSDLSIYRGDSKVFSINITDSVGPVNITGCVLYFTVKETFAQNKSEITDENALIKKEVSVHVDAVNGSTEVVFSPSDTNSLKPKEYVYDLSIKDSNDNIVTFTKSKFVVVADVTRVNGIEEEEL